MLKKILSINILILILFLGTNCTGLLYINDSLSRKSNGIYLKYPVVLVHGIIALDRELWGHFFWGRIPERLEKHGIEYYYGGTDAWGSIESNAEILYDNIENILLDTGCEKVNIIAHSKGGIDSRYLIWKYDYGDKVASLTTISTPHRGAEFSDLIYGQELLYTDAAKNIIDVFELIYGDSNPDMYAVNYQLTTEYMTQFNETVGMVDERVYFQALYTTMAKPSDDLMLSYSFTYTESIAGPNDGLVSAASASWGGNSRQIPGRISHNDIVDFRRRKIRRIDIPQIYIDILRDLSNKGY